MTFADAVQNGGIARSESVARKDGNRDAVPSACEVQSEDEARKEGMLRLSGDVAQNEDRAPSDAEAWSVVDGDRYHHGVIRRSGDHRTMIDTIFITLSDTMVDTMNDTTTGDMMTGKLHRIQ